MKTYALKDKTTGMFLSYHISPSRAEANTKSYPRLMPTRRSAASVLSSWLVGIWHLSYGYNGEDQELAPRKVSTRIRENMEIVEFDLQETAK